MACADVPLTPTETSLGRFFNLHEADLAKAKSGDVVAKLLDTQEKREVAVVGLAYLNVPADFFLERYRDIMKFKVSPAVERIGKFGRPPNRLDLAQLMLERADAAAFRRCKPGDCKVRMSTPMMSKIRASVDWSSNLWLEQANQATRQVLADYVAAYTRVGNAALIVYEDKEQPTRLAEEYSSVLNSFPYIREVVPGLYDHLAGHHPAPPQGTEDFVYWSEEKSSPLKPVISFTHVLLHRHVAQGRTWDVIVGKQIYASHYSDGSIGLTFLISDHGGPSAQGCWMVYSNRTRVDALRGWLAPVKRPLVRSAIRSAVDREIHRIKTRLEASYSEGRPRSQ